MYWHDYDFATASVIATAYHVLRKVSLPYHLLKLLWVVMRDM
jgi:hypothetical protein